MWVIQSNPMALIGFGIPYNGRATGVPPVTVRGLDQHTEEYARSPATQDRNHPLLDSPEQDNPAVGRDPTAHTAE